MSIDTGLFFERDTSFAGTGLLHTLEPRLFYLYVPYKNQDALPVFDTAPSTFTQTLLFSENRFNGFDRIGDANQLTTALTTRFYRQDNGQELFNATIGQIIYFQDREVTLPGQPVDTATRSSYLANVLLAPNPRLKFIGDLQWDPDTSHTEVSNARLQYAATGGRVINLNQRFRRNDIRTQGISFAWRTSPSWQFFGGHEYDLENDHRLENFIGVRYDDCCWGLRLVGLERFDEAKSSSELTYENAVYLELELKGFSSIGSRNDIDQLLEDGILGYSR
jgi:LPS-assembly protein